MEYIEHLTERKIIHIDMDAFYASVEQLDNPELRNLPIAVGGGGERGVVMAASYEARKFNVKSALSGRIAKERCPNLVFVPPRFERYKEVSTEIRSIFYEYTDLVEPLSLDEAFLDVTENKKNNPSAGLIAKEIRSEIYTRLGLRASAGISVNKFLAKTASDINKPNGQKTISPKKALAFLEELPVNRFFGVGKVTAKKMNDIGIFNGKDIKARSLHELIHNFGKAGKQYHKIVRGIPISQVNPNRLRKSIAVENTFTNNITEEADIIAEITQIALELEKRIHKTKLKGKTITVKIKYKDFSIETRSKSFAHYVHVRDEFLPSVIELIKKEELKDAVRLLGISLKNLNNQINYGASNQLEFDYFQEEQDQDGEDS
jgi:DNA polymerase-4